MDTETPRHRFIVDIPEGLARKASRLVGDGFPYQSISDLVTTALENQIQLQEGPTTGYTSVSTAVGLEISSTPPTSLNPPPQRRQVPAGWRPQETVEPLLASGPLGSFTNRLSPLVALLRELAIMQVELGDQPSWTRLCERSAAVARAVGVSARKRDQEAARRGLTRWWTGWPVGADEESSLARYRRHFAGRLGLEPEDVPAVALGLIAPLGDGVQFTELGLEFALSPTPILGECSGESPLSPRQREILATGLRRMPAEWDLIELALSVLEANGGLPASLDEALLVTMPSFSPSQATSQRAALIGRMLDAGIVVVDTETGLVQPNLESLR